MPCAHWPIALGMRKLPSIAKWLICKTRSEFWTEELKTVIEVTVHLINTTLLNSSPYALRLMAYWVRLRSSGQPRRISPTASPRTGQNTTKSLHSSTPLSKQPSLQNEPSTSQMRRHTATLLCSLKMSTSTLLLLSIRGQMPIISWLNHAWEPEKLYLWNGRWLKTWSHRSIWRDGVVGFRGSVNPINLRLKGLLFWRKTL